MRRTRPVEEIVSRNTPQEGVGERSLDRQSLVLIGFAVLIGAGIFSVTAGSIFDNGAVNTLLGVLLAGISFYATAMCYAEFASTVPVAGSAFTYAQAGIGLIPAWGIGCLLIVEYAFGSAAVSVTMVGTVLQENGNPVSGPEGPGALVLLVSLVVVCGLGVVVHLGGLRSVVATSAIALTWAKMAAIVVAVVGGVIVIISRSSGPAAFVKLPDGKPFSIDLIVNAVGAVLFAYAGFDAVTPAADEATYPRRDLPRAMLSALFLTIITYVLLTAVATKLHDPARRVDSVAAIFGAARQPVLGGFVVFAAIVGQLTVAYVLLYGLSRILTALVREIVPATVDVDGTRAARTVSIGSTALVLAPILMLTIRWSGIALFELVSTATALAFGVVVLGTVSLRRRRPDLLRTVQVPALGAVATIALVVNVLVVAHATAITWIVIAVVTAIFGLVVCGGFVLATRFPDDLNERDDSAPSSSLPADPSPTPR